MVPPKWRDHVRVGTMVRVDLSGRRVAAWVVALREDEGGGDGLKAIAKVTGWGPAPEVIELAEWAAWRWAGRLVPLLVSASAPGAITALPPAPPRRAVAAGPDAGGDALFAGGPGVVVARIAPTDDPYDLVIAAARRGSALVVCPSVSLARGLAARLRRGGVPVALLPRDWALAAAGGCVVIGARAAAWAPCPDLAAVVVLDEHDETLAEERAPTWNARDVAVERARRAGVPCVLASPCPSLETLALGPLVVPTRNHERAAWPIVDMVDRSRETGAAAAGVISERVARLLHTDGRVVCVLNRTGRARLLACAACQTVARCERCGAGVAEEVTGTVRCGRCGTERPLVCLSCSSTRLVNRRPGIARVATDLGKMLGEPVAVLTGQTADGPGPVERVVVGTEAALHQVPDARVVAFLDIDAELLAPRYRAAEEAMALLVRAARLVGPRAGGGRVVVQTRLGRHEVLDAAVMADPGRLVDGERRQREALGLPPSCALAAISGPAAGALVESLRSVADITLLGPADGTWLVKAPDHARLSDALAAAGRPPGRVRVEVDPRRL